ncbi:MAG: hypothetical protein ACRCX2_08905 [Paraclostridium sp.]
MEDRAYKGDLKKMILDMTQKELQNYVSQKGSSKHIESQIDKIINDNIYEIKRGSDNVVLYTKMIKNGSNKANINEISKMIKKEDILKSKVELLKFGRYLDLEVNPKQGYKLLLKRISSHIYNNRSKYNKKYVVYKKENEEYILEPNKVKKQLIEIYKSKARNDMRSIARILNLKTDEDESAEDIRKKVINYIITDKLIKIKN